MATATEACSIAPRGTAFGRLSLSEVAATTTLVVGVALLVTAVATRDAALVTLPAAASGTLYRLLQYLAVFFAFTIFFTQWRVAPIPDLRDPRVQLLGTGFLAVALLDGLHVLALQGLTPLAGGGMAASRAWFYWYMARLFAGCAFLAAAWLPRSFSRCPGYWGPFGACVLGIGAVVVAARLDDLNLAAFQPVGSFANFFNAAITVAAVAAVVGFVRHWRFTRDRIWLVMAAAVGVLALYAVMVAVFAFREATRDLGMLGPALKVAAYALTLDGLFVNALVKPHRRLRVVASELRTRNAELEALRDHIENELERKVALLGSIIEAIPEAVVVYDTTGRIIEFNKGAKRMLGYSDATLLAPLEERTKALGDIEVDGREVTAVRTAISRTLAGEALRGNVQQLVGAPGNPWVSFNSGPVRLEDGTALGAVVTIADVTRLRELQDQREDLLYSVSHDLKTPLIAIQLQAQRISRIFSRAGMEVEGRAAETIVSNTRRMNGIILDLVDSARLTSGMIRLAREAVSIPTLVDELLARSGEAIPRARIELHLDDLLPPAFADPFRLERALTNLLTNALKYSPADSRVEVRARAEGNEVIVSVTDHGTGIKASEREKIFQRFFRTEPAQAKEGMGLGLYVARLLVELHGGRIGFESEEGVGSTFWFSVPAATCA